MRDLLIVGAGLAGLFSAAFAARRGAKVTLIAEGRGSLGLSHGCIDIAGPTPPHLAIQKLPDDHPYALAGIESLEAAVREFRAITQSARLAYSGELGRALHLPTALGGDHATSLAPSPLAAGDLTDGNPLTIADFQGFRDFHAALATAELQRRGLPVREPLHLPLLDAPTHRDSYATDLARLFDEARSREEIARAWKPRMRDVGRLGLPAVIGLDRSSEAFEDLGKRIGVPIFEIPTLPPSLPGLRLERALQRVAVAEGVWVIEGARAVGRVDGRSEGRRVAGVIAQTAGGPRLIDASAVLLASGGILNGGLVAQQDGLIHESVFGLPAFLQGERAGWTSDRVLGPQPYARFGLAVGRDMRPLDREGRPYFENLFAAGGLLAGADRTSEGSRQGIDLATAYRAVEAALG